MYKNKKTLDAMTDSAQFMLECEARFWKEMVRKNGRGWWNARKDAIARQRGTKALEHLLEVMNGKK